MYEEVYLINDETTNKNEGIEEEPNDPLKWTNSLTHTLIAATKQFYNEFDFKFKKNVWNLIAKEVSKLSGIMVNGQQCDTKFKLLKKK